MNNYYYLLWINESNSSCMGFTFFLGIANALKEWIENTSGVDEYNKLFGKRHKYILRQISVKYNGNNASEVYENLGLRNWKEALS